MIGVEVKDTIVENGDAFGRALWSLGAPVLSASRWILFLWSTGCLVLWFLVLESFRPLVLSGIARPIVEVGGDDIS